MILVIIFILTAFTPSFYFYQKYQQVLKEKSSILEASEVNELVERVGKHILLPADETPTVLTVTDKDKLSGQQFFANAKNGDKVLVYHTAQKAFLFDPVADRIIEVGPVIASDSTTSIPQALPTVATAAAAPVVPTPDRAAKKEIRFVLYNGTKTVGLTRRYEPILKEKVPEAVVVDRDNAKNQDYQQSLLIDLSGSHPKAQEIAADLDLKLESLPQGELKPEADFLIILGENRNR